MADTRWHGVHTILVTPFKADYSLDREGMRRNVRFAAEGPTHVVTCLGTQGEFYALTTEERKEVMRIVVEETRGRKPVVCGISAPSTLEALDLGRHAREVGADALMITPPYFCGAPPQSVYDFFTGIAREIGLPLFLYNNPSRVGVNLPPATLAKLAGEEHVVGVKQASDSMTELEETVALAGKKMAVICGSESMSWPCLMLGMVGFTSTAASFMPRVPVAIYDLALKGDVAGGLDLFYRLSPLRLLGRATGIAALVKAGAEMVGLAGGPVRLPLPQVSEEHRARLREILRDLGVL